MEHNQRIAYETIYAAKQGDDEAMTEIVRYYEPYISHFSKRQIYDEYGIPHDVVDEEMKSLIISEYMSAVFFRYDLTRLPKGATLE